MMTLVAVSLCSGINPTLQMEIAGSLARRRGAVKGDHSAPAFSRMCSNQQSAFFTKF
jgi:hypothetical protein